MGNIGIPTHTREFEPLPATVPIHEPSPAPMIPEPVPA